MLGQPLGGFLGVTNVTLKCLTIFTVEDIITCVRSKHSSNAHLVKFHSKFSYSLLSRTVIFGCNILWIKPYWYTFWCNHKTVSSLYFFPSSCFPAFFFISLLWSIFRHLINRNIFINMEYFTVDFENSLNNTVDMVKNLNLRHIILNGSVPWTRATQDVVLRAVSVYDLLATSLWRHTYRTPIELDSKHLYIFISSFSECFYVRRECL